MSTRRWLSILIVAAVPLAACGDGTPAPSGVSIVVDVTVELGPGCPVEQESVPCATVPLSGFEVVATSGDQTVRERLPADGRLALLLPEGRWVITATAGMSCEPVTVSVSGPAVVRCDTGIR